MFLAIDSEGFILYCGHSREDMLSKIGEIEEERGEMLNCIPPDELNNYDSFLYFTVIEGDYLPVVKGGWEIDE